MLINVFVKFINLIIMVLSSIIEFIITVLPSSPFNHNYLSEIPYINYLNWVIPIQTMTNIMFIWLIYISLYYGYTVLARWGKVIK